MKKYIEYAADIYDIYLDYIDPNDIHVYSIDEAFIDATDYLRIYNKEAREFALFLINQIANRKHIPAAAGIGTNLGCVGSVKPTKEKMDMLADWAEAVE